MELIASSLSKITRDIEIIKKDFSSLVNGNAFIKIVSYTPESAEIEDCEKIEENFKKKIIDRFSFF